MAQAVSYVWCCLTVLCVYIGEAYGAPPVSLDSAVKEALANNPALKSLEREKEAAASEYWDAVIPDNPELFAEYEGIPDGEPLSGFEARKLGIGQRIEFPYVYVLRSRAKKLESALLNSEIGYARNEIAADVTKRFYRVILADIKRKEYGEIHTLTAELLDKARIRVAAGDVSPYDTLKVKVDIADIDNLVRSAEAGYEQSLYELKLLLGRTRQETLDIAGSLDLVPVSFDPDSLKARAMRVHPLLRSHLNDVAVKETEARITRYSLIPSVDISWFNHSLPGSAEPDAWGGSVGLSIPLWGFVKERGKIQAARLRAEAAGWRVDSEKRVVLGEVDRASNELLLARDRVENYRANTLAEVDELVRIATKSYEEGEMGYLEVAEAYRSRYRTNVGYAEACYDYLAALADLEKAVGMSITGNK